MASIFTGGSIAGSLIQIAIDISSNAITIYRSTCEYIQTKDSLEELSDIKVIINQQVETSKNPDWQGLANDLCIMSFSNFLKFVIKKDDSIFDGLDSYAFNKLKFKKDNYLSKISSTLESTNAHLHSLGVITSVFSIASTIILDLLESNLVKVM